MRESGISPISCNTYTCGVNAYLRWLYDEGHISEQLSIPRLKVEQKILQTFSQAHVNKLLAWKPRRFGQHRLHALVCLLLDTGLRIAEALMLVRDNIDLENMIVKVKGKGEKHRVVPMSFELRRILYRWLRKHQFDLVFPTRNGTQTTHRNNLREFKRLGKRLGISGVRVSFHTLRHTFATAYLRNGGDVFRLQRILGHSTLEMTRRYVNLQTQDLQAVHNKLSLLSVRR
jgi:integrase/recombinase XerD